MSIKIVLNKLTSMVLVICMLLSLAAPAVGEEPLTQPVEETVYSDGTIVYEDGTILYTDGTLVYADGTTVHADGTTVNTDGTTVYPDGTAVYPDGKMVYADGTTVYPDGTTVYADGTVAYADGTIVYADGTTIHADGTAVNADGTTVYPDGTTVYADGTMVYADGTMAYPDGTVVYPDGTTLNVDGTTVYPNGTTVYADGTTVYTDGTTVYPDGTTVYPDGTTVYPDGTTVYPDGTTVNPNGTNDSVIEEEPVPLAQPKPIIPDVVVETEGENSEENTAVLAENPEATGQKTVDPLNTTAPASESQPVTDSEAAGGEAKTAPTIPGKEAELAEEAENAEKAEDTEKQESAENAEPESEEATEENAEGQTEENPAETTEDTVEETTEETTEEPAEEPAEEPTEETTEETTEDAAEDEPEETTENPAAPVEELPLRTLTVSAGQMAFRDQFLNPREPVLWSGSVWNWLYGTAIEPLYTDDRVTVEISGHLPENVTARAMFIEFADPGAAQNDERALMLLDVALLDENGALYVPTKKLHVSVSAASISGAAASGEPFAAYFDDSYDGVGAAGDIKVRLDEGIDGSRLAYVPEQNEALRFWEAGGRLVSTGNGTVEFDENRFPFRFVLSAQQEAREEEQAEIEQENVVKDIMLSGTLVASDGYTYEVSVSYPANCGIPVGAQLSVEELIVGTDAYWDYINQSAAELGISPADLSLARAFDISLVDPETGVHYQPTQDVQVSITLISTPVNTEEEIAVLHFDDEAGEVQTMDVALNGETIEFETSGFSVFTVLQKGKSNNQTAGDGTDDADDLLLAAAAVKELTITADSGTKVYDGTALTKNSYTNTELTEGDSIESVTITGSQTVAGTCDNEPGAAKIVNAAGEDVTENYSITYVNGLLEVTSKELTITAGSDTKVHGEPAQTNEYTYTDLAEGDRIESVMVTGSQTKLGSSDNVPSEAKIVNTAGEDVTESYDITYVNGTLTVTWPDGLLRKELTEFNGDLATYSVVVNPSGEILNDGDSLTLKDTFSSNQSVLYSSVQITGGTYDFSENTGTYTVPDGEEVTITYTTRVQGSAGDQVSFSNTAFLGRMDEGTFIGGASVLAEDSETITPTGSDISGTDGVYSIDLYVYAEGHMEKGLEGAAFRLLDSNMQAMTYRAGAHIGEPIMFTTGDNGYVTITLNEENDGVSIRKNTVYYLEMVTAPFQLEDGTYIYYQKDSTYYSFLITDNPDYSYGGVYSYYNGDTLKVRCYPEAKGVNITKRFSGNYSLTDEQKNAITFTLQKEALGTAGGWVNVESHTYGEFSYGSINFNIGKADGADLEDFATYRVVEENALPEELQGIIEENVAVTVSYQMDGRPVEEDSNEFLVDPDDKLAFSYNFTFTNQYIDHKLTIIKVDKNTGHALPGTVFTVYAAVSDTPVGEYTTDNSGSITIHRGDAGAAYSTDTLYYAVETETPGTYLLPDAPERVYFYFSENSSTVPAGLPSGETATDLTTSYNTVTIANDSDSVDVPVTVVWGANSNEPWPAEVDHIVAGLYQRVDGTEAVPVKDDQGRPLTVTLTRTASYDAASFTKLPALADRKRITYSIVEEGIYGSGDADITSRYARSSSISGTGWYVIKNQAAESVKIQKAWYELDGSTEVGDTSGKAAVTFDLYRTTTEPTATAFSRAELEAVLAGAEPVREGLALAAEEGWTLTVDSLEKTDKQGNLYYYFALEHVPDNQEDSYLVAPSDGTEPRTLTIRNTQTPVTITIKAGDLEKTYGDADPAYVLEADVKEAGTTVSITGPDESGNYTAQVTGQESGAKNILFTVSREAGENVGTYAVTPAGDAIQEGYRVLFETADLTVNPAEVTITAGAEKTYGEPDPELVTITGMKNNEEPSILSYTVSREEGEDVDEYPITLTGETLQGNYRVTYVRTDAENKPAVLKINRAPAVVTAVDAAKNYGEDDPVFTANVTGLQFADEASVINYDLTRTPGEDVGSDYVITPAGEAEQGNYTVTYVPAAFTIRVASLTIKVVDAEKTYGDEDPEWEVDIDGLQRNEDSGTLSSVVAPDTGERSYTYSVGEGEDAKTLLSFTVTRESGENVGEYALTPEGDATQGNYTLTYEPGTLTILRAELVVTPDNIVKAVGLTDDPLLTATVTGWANGDDEAEAEHTVGEGENAGIITWTYTRNSETLLTFTLKRDAGEEEGEYPVTAEGEETQSNYIVDYQQGVFGILAVLDVDVTQPVVDDTDPNANPSYTYTATLDLTGTGLTEYNKNGFVEVDGVPTLSFTLPEERENIKTLKVPGGAKLTVRQDTTDDNYTTSLSMDGAPVASEEDPVTCVLDTVDTYHEIAFTHSRISLPVSAKAAVGQTEEGAVTLEGRKGAMGVPDSSRAIDADFADEMHSKIGYVLPADKYYVYDHASLYTTSGSALEGATNVTEIRYNRENAGWEYKTNGEYTSVPEGAQLVLFYLPKYVCKIGTEKFYTLRAAVEYADENGKTAMIEMLIQDYSIRSASELVTIPADCQITITTAENEYEGTDTAVISRSMGLTGGHLFTNNGSLTFDNIILDGKNVRATDAAIRNNAETAELTVAQGAVLRNASGVNGGAIYVNAGTVNVNGALSGNTATNGGAVYVNAGTVNLAGSLTGNNATNGGAVYINKGAVTLSGTLEQNEAVSGGAVYQIGGELTVSGSMAGNSASGNGGGVYLNNGTCMIETGGSLSDNSTAGNGGAICQTGGTLNNTGTISGNSASNGGGIYRTGGELTVGGTVRNNTAGVNGGGIYSVGGTVNLNATVAGNGAENGGAVYASGTTLNLNGGSVTGNTSGGNGGAIYALNATTTIYGTIQIGDTDSGNTATGNGGAVYMEGGSLTIQNADSKLMGNHAANGGAVYATSGKITLTNGELSGNEAVTSGGAIYADSASVTVEAGKLQNNTAGQGKGGAICSESGTVTVSGGTLSGNGAERGNGGAVYTNSGTVNYTGGNINGGNTAINGAAIYVGSGIANISASITGNTATNGGAIGVGSTNARLYFTGAAEVNSNKMNGAESNVYLDVDSELVINASSLNSGKKIGVYVPGDVNSDQVVKHGDVTGYFGAYVTAGTLANMTSVFKNDRFTDLKVAYENNRLYWYSSLTYDIYYLEKYNSNFPPITSTPSKAVVTGQSYVPRTRESDIYDLVMAMKLYEKHDGTFKSKVGNNYASTAVYAYTYSDKAMNNTFENYLQKVEWDATARKWKYIKQDGTEAPSNTSKLVIFYSAPAYLTIVNNNNSNLTLDISELKVLNKNAGDGVYGFVTAKNGATIQTLRTITNDEDSNDLKLNAGDSIKLMFPGAQGQSFTLKGEFTGEGAGESTAVTYTFNGGNPQTITGTSVDLSDSTFKLYASDKAAEIIFGSALPICKIGDMPFSTLKAAMAYADAQKTATGNNTYKIEMLVDYLVPADDVLEIQAGYDITFTTADPNAETLPYTGSGTRATLSRDTGNAGSSVTARSSTLTVDNLAFDGRSLTAGGKGGAVSAENCATVTITNCEFKGYRADNGGAVYVNNTSAGSSLTVENCAFSNCQTNASVDKAGGGGVWTTARELYVRNCIFDFCACTLQTSNAQAGSIFHNIQGGWSANSKTVISDCMFSNSYSAGGSGGTVESDALDITIERCSFAGSYTNKSNGNGGAINVYANNEQNTSKYCILKVIDCTFDDCSAKNGSAVGGAVRTTSHDLILSGCVFRNTQSVKGGAVAMTNTNAKKLEIYGCTFENCIATGNGGAVSAPVPTLIVGSGNIGTYLDGTERDGQNYFSDCTANRGGGIDNDKDNASVTLQNVNFTRCAARTSNGGAMYTKAQTLSIAGDSNTFTACTGNGSGGAVYQNRNAANSSVTLENCEFSGCEANNNGNGGGLYANARTLTISGNNNGFINCTAANAGGGLYHDYAGTASIKNCAFETCTAKAGAGGGLYARDQSLTISGENSAFRSCTAQTNGGGVYHDTSANNSVFTFRDGSFENCTAVGNYGGAVYTPARTVTLADCAIKDSTAKANGGGVYTSAVTTGSFDGCTISGNTVTNSDSKGGGVYISGGTTTYRNSTVSDCSAANGGGWYQNNGTLYILGGSISGSAVNGGGLYVNDAKTNVNHYGGTVAGTASANGGGVYKNNGTYTIGDATYEDTACSGACIGTATTDEDGNPVYTATAVNGGGIYQNAGTLVLNAGSGVSGQATANGGGIWNKTTVNHNGGDVTGSAVNGGGVWQQDTTNGSYHFNGGTITGTASENGGAVYQGGKTFTINNGAVLGEKTTDEVISSEAKNGGGLYVAAGTATMNAGSTVAGANASQNGAGVFVAGGTFAFKGGEIVRNTASENGGGVYVAGGVFSMTDGGAVIGGSEENANTANKGAGIFVANGQTASFNDWTSKTLEISHNHALTEGGGIAVGGPEAVLNFQNAVTVRYNTMGANNTECNVYLDQDRNTIINNTYLNAASYIGVYASDDQDAGHGQPGMPFGTYTVSANNDGSSNLNVYHNDRLPYLYGVKGSSNNEVVWSEFVCKITDGSGNLLYKDANGTPAVYAELENRKGGDIEDSAFYALNNKAPAFYTKDGEKYTGKEYQVQLLIQDYDMGSGQVKLNNNRGDLKITLTTASVTPDECGFQYIGDPRFYATVRRSANGYAMIYADQNWELTLQNITIDGGGKQSQEEGGIVRLKGNSSVILNTGALLQNIVTQDMPGAGVYLDSSNNSLTMNAGSIIRNCSAGAGNGGGVAVNNGTFTMNGGTISGCTAAGGGGVWLNNSGKLNMKGGTITGNNAAAQGGGIALVNQTARATFSGYCTVMDNILNGSERCNLQLGQDSNDMIVADELDARAEIGVYTADGDIYNNHGESGDPFGTWTLPDDKLFCFVNDRSTNLRGFQSANESDRKIYWEYHPLLTVTKSVVSDWAYDQDTAEFSFEVKLIGSSQFSLHHNQYGDMDFNQDGVATVKLKAGESATAILPDDFDKYTYEVTEVLSEAQAADYTTEALKDEKEYSFTEDKPLTVTGQLGENIGTDHSTSLSEVSFVNTRATGELTISKTVVSEVEADKNERFDFKLKLDDTGISKTYEAARKDNAGTETSEELSFTEGVASFALMHGESLTIHGLPTDLGYTVEEVPTESQLSHTRTQVSKDGAEAVYSLTQEGTIGEKSTIENVDGEKKTVYASEVTFTNIYLEIVCKITNRSRALLYFRDASGRLQPAIYSHLEDAFEQINSGNLRTAGNGTVSGALRIEMVVPEYTMEGSATLSSGKTVVLSTALPTDEEYPYNHGVGDGNGNISTVSRGFTGDSMIVDSGALTLDKIILDGASEVAGSVTNADGGIVRVEGAVRLTVNSSATLQNSETTGNGGAIYLSTGASLTMNGTIINCAAAAGGGVYADAGFTTIASTGTISGCEATDGNGGAIYASTGTSVNLNAGTSLTGNMAASDGGAVYSEANVVLRGTVGGTGTNEGNTAAGSGGGIAMGSGTVFTMYAGSSISGNQAVDGGGLATQSTARIAGGNLAANSASEMGGAVFATENAVVTVSGTSAFTENTAGSQGGAVYDGGSLAMTGGSMTANSADASGGAVYVADGKTFTMSNGSIRENKSVAGAVSTGESSVLVFSGNAVVSGNTDLDGTDPMNVFLGYDSNSIITTSGLGASAYIGVYVADGDPEDESIEDHVDNPIYADHGVGGRNFGTYTGSNINSARLNKFVNDRDTTLTGMAGAETDDGSSRFVAWAGKGLQLKVTQHLIKMDSEGNPVLDDKGNPVLSDEVVPVQNASFTFSRVVEEGDNIQVWTGKSDENGLVAIPWSGSEKADGNAASFVPGSVYVLNQTAADGKTVLPAGHWEVRVSRDNSLEWKVLPSDESNVDRTLEIILPERVFLGETFGLKNDVKPTLTYNATGGKLQDKSEKRTDTIAFSPVETSHEYTITEKNPTWDSHVFRIWATMETKPTGENNIELTEEKLSELGYFEYAQNDDITFFRGTDSDEPAEKYTENVSKGDMILYAQWDEVVCKITDRDGTLLYINGSPAVYGTLEACFTAYNKANMTTFTYKSGSRATARRIEMLVGEYTLKEPVELGRGKTVMLTTAPENDTDGYSYTGEPGTVCVISRGEGCNTSMITNNSNLTLMGITLDGSNTAVLCDGGIVNNAQLSAVLTVASGATLRNSVVDGNGGAVNLTAGTTMNMTGGTIRNNKSSGNGGAIFIAPGSTVSMTGGTISGNASGGIGGGIYLDYLDKSNYGVLNLSGDPSFGDGNFQTGENTITNGGVTYTRARQDIVLTGLGDTGEAESPLLSLVVAGTIHGDKGSIWVWAEDDNSTEEINHYKVNRQFAVIGAAVPETTLQVFRNARPDSDTDNNTGEYLYGTSEGDTPGYVYWSGVKGSRRVILRKIDNTYASVSGKTFTIYKGSATTPYQPKGESALAGLQSGLSGCFWIGDLPYGWYIVEEGASGPYFYIVVTESGNYGTDFIGGYGARTDAENDAAAKYNVMKQSQ